MLPSIIMTMAVSVAAVLYARQRRSASGATPLVTRERFLECLSEVSEQLLRASELTEVLPVVLRRLGETIEVSRVSLFGNYLGPEGELLCGRRCEWCAPGVEPQMDNAELRDFHYISRGCARWVEVLGQGGVIGGDVADFPASERPVLESQGIRSTLIIPIFVSGAWHGFSSFDACDRTREWQQGEVDLLRVVASAIAGSIERVQIRLHAQALAEATAALTSALDFDQVLDRILEQVSYVVPNDAVNIMLVEGDRARVVRWRGYDRFGAEEFVSTVVFHIPDVPNLRRMAETGKPILISDTATDHSWIRLPPVEWLRSYVAVPIVVHEQVIGFLNMDSATPGFFNQAHLEPLLAFANHAAAAIENVRLFEAAQRRVAELEAVRQASLSLTASLELEAVLGAILEHTLHLISADDAHIFLYDGERLTFGAALWAGGLRREPYAQPRPAGLTYAVARTGERVVVSDAKDHHLFQGQPWDWEGAILGLPLRVGDQVRGVMNVAFEKPHVFSEDELRILELLADQAAIAIENARLFQVEQRQTRRLALLADVARIAAATLDADELLQAVADSIHRHFAYHMVELFTLDDERKTLVLRGYSGVPIGSPGTVTPGIYRQPIEQGIVGYVARTGKPYLAPDVRADPYFLRVGEIAIRSELCVPIFDAGRVVGVIDVESIGLADFDEDDRSLLEVVADTMAIGLRNIRLYEETRRRVRELTLLNRISAGFGAALNLETMINGALEGLHELVGADRTYFITTDPEARTWETTHELVAPGIEPDIGLSGTFDDVAVELGAILSGQPFAVFDIATDPRVEATREMYLSLGMQSMLLVPVQVGRWLYGVLGFDYCRHRHAWQPEEVRLLEGVAHQLGLAMENVRLFEEARLRADELADALARQEELDRLKSEFIQNVSHELRTPLALIRGYAEMLCAGDLGEVQPVQRKPIAVISRRTRMLSDLVEDITFILEAETNPPEPEPVKLDELTRASVEDFQVMVEQAGLTLDAEIAPHLPPVNGSPTYLRRVLDNLLGNAAKFTPAGGRITVRVRQEGEQVVLEVSDTGVGIPADQLERIFERFYQVNGSVRRQYGGVGLGLALVKSIVETYGGRVTVESRVGEGSTFTVWFPIA